MESAGKSQENHCFNALKGIACMGVVFGHALFPGEFGAVIFVLASEAVPIFFLISGFYAYDSDRIIVAQKTVRKFRKTVKLTVGACLLYFVWKFVKLWLLGYSVLDGIGDFNLKNLVKMLLQNDLSFIEAGHFWFLLALIYAYATLIILAKWNMIHWIYPVIILTFIGRVYMCGNANWHYSQNYWFDGLPYFFTGYYLKANENWKDNISNGFLLVIGMMGILFKTSGLFYDLGVNIYEVGAILFALSLFIFALKHEYIGENSVWERLGKQYSLWIYIYHVIVMGILTLYEDNMGLRSMPWYPWCKPLVVFFLTLGLGVIWQKGRTFILKKKNK